MCHGTTVPLEYVSGGDCHAGRATAHAFQRQARNGGGLLPRGRSGSPETFMQTGVAYACRSQRAGGSFERKNPSRYSHSIRPLLETPERIGSRLLSADVPTRAEAGQPSPLDDLPVRKGKSQLY